MSNPNSIQAAALLARYDAGEVIVSSKLSIPDEVTGQRLCMEVLRAIVEKSPTEQEWNDTPDIGWIAIMGRASQLAQDRGLDLTFLSLNHIMVAGNLASNYYEHGYDFIIEYTSQENQVTFQKSS